MYKFFVFSFLIFLGACGFSKGPDGFPKITEREESRLDHPDARLLKEIEIALPKSVAEVRKSEAISLKYGRPLNAKEMELARAVGVNYPEKIRVYFTNDFPIDEKTLGPGGVVIALTMNYGIFVKPEILPHRKAYLEVITHEFAHVVQFETLGIDGMSRRFMLEKYVLGNKLIPIERDAIVMGNKVYDDPKTNYGY